MNFNKKVVAALLLAMTMVVGAVLPGVSVSADSESVPYLALGADLTNDERSKVFSLLNVDASDLDAYNVLYVTNEDEHEYLDEYIASSVIGTRALSCVLIQKRTEGYGLKVTTHNITYCTPSMYVNALSTAGITDSRVVVAGPFPISGTAALVGAMKAYEDMTGEEISEEFQDAAMNELVVEGAIGEAHGEDEEDPEIEQFILDLKLEVSEREFDEKTEREDMEALIRERATERNLELSEEILNQLVDLMIKINKLNLDKEQIKQQTEVITEEPAASTATEAAGQTTEAADQEKKESTTAPAAATEASTQADSSAAGQETLDPEQVTAQGQAQIDAFNEYFQDEDKTLALVTSIQDDITKLQTENEDGAAVTQEQKKEIIKEEFIKYGIIPAEEVDKDLSSYDGQIDSTLLVIDNIDLFNLDLEGYRQRMAAASSQQGADQTDPAQASSQAAGSDGEAADSTENQEGAADEAGQSEEQAPDGEDAGN